MELTALLPLLYTVIGMVLSFYKIQSIQAERERRRDQEWQKYVDRELQFIRELYNNQIIVLNEKVDRLIILVEKMRDKDE